MGELFSAKSLTLHLNEETNQMEYRCYDVDPNSFNFTDKANVTLNTITLSEILPITGISSNAPVTISGTGSPQFRICSDVNCNSVVQNWGNEEKTITNNQYLQIRLTPTTSTMYSANIKVGDVNDNWIITTVTNISSEVIFNILGTYSWTVPMEVASVSVITVGGGGAGAGGITGGGGGGGGGALRYKNNISVTPGSSVSITVGSGGIGSINNGTNGGASSFGSSCSAVGGLGSNGVNGALGGATGVGDGGGNGGNGGNGSGYGGGGAGAGGYAGNGGQGGNYSGNTQQGCLTLQN